MKEKFTDKSLDYLFATDETETQKWGEKCASDNNLYRLFSNNFGINYKNTSHPLF